MRDKIIWVINQTAGKPDSGWGERHYYFSKYWIKKGYDVKIISGSHNHLFTNQPRVFGKTFTFDKVEEGITFCWVKTPKYVDGGYGKFWSNFVFMIKVFFVPTKKLGKPENIIVSSMPIFPILCGYYFKKRFKVRKLFIEIRDLWPLSPIYLKGYSSKHPLVQIVGWFEKFAYKKSDEIISLLPNAHNYINNISGDVKKFNWISNGIDTNLLEDEVISKHITDKIPENKFIIGYTGTMNMANALEYLIEASILLKSNLDIHFVLVGDGYLKNELEERTMRNLNVTFIPKIRKNQVQNLLEFFDVCFIGRNNTPLFNHGVASNKYFDYMLAKKPILESSNRINSPSEMSKCGITVEPDNAQAIVQGILKFQSMSSFELMKIGEKGYLYVLKFHNFDYLSEKYLKLF